MAAQLHILVRDMLRSEVLESKIRKNLAGLEKICPRITAFHVTLEAPQHHHHKGAQFSVKLEIRLPGAEIVVTRDHDEDIYVALREACQAVRRQLGEHLERARESDGEYRHHHQRNAAVKAPGNE